MKPDPQVISRRLFTRAQSNPELCNAGFGTSRTMTESDCDYQKAPFFNVLAAYWIQFMTHDWFSHMEEGHNDDSQWMEVGCSAKPRRSWDAARATASTAAMSRRTPPPAHSKQNGKEYLTRAPKTFRNTNTAWWDASQLYGYDAPCRANA